MCELMIIYSWTFHFIQIVMKKLFRFLFSIIVLFFLSLSYNVKPEKITGIMKTNKKKFESLFKGNRSFSVVHSVMDYFSHIKPDAQAEGFQKEQWNIIVSDQNIPQNNLKHIFYKIQYQLLFEKTQRQKRFLVRVSQIAAILILPLALFLLHKYNQRVDLSYQVGKIEIHCPEGTRSKFNLPDGSTGWIAGGSSISYDANFQNNRKISVDGEAFFNVAKDKKHPFGVQLNDYEVIVLGTKFNVLNYIEDPISEVVVLSGLVQVNGKTKKFSEQLTKDQKLQLQKEENRLYLSDIDAESYTSWIHGRLEFNNEDLSSVCRKIERFYDVDTELNIDGLEDQLFRANIQIGSIDELLRFMALTLPINYELIDAYETANGNIEQRKLKIYKKEL